MAIEYCRKDNKPGFRSDPKGYCYTYTPDDKRSRERAKKKAQDQLVAIIMAYPKDERLKTSLIRKIFGSESEFARDMYKNADYEECAECYSKLLDLGDPHSSTKYAQAKDKADKAIALAKNIDGGILCKKYGILVAELVQAFVDKAERLWKLQKGVKEFTK